MFDQLAARFGHLISSSRGFHGFIGVYLAVTYVARVALFPGASPDDSEQLLFSQGLAWGYEPGNPPLFTWLVIAAQNMFGISIATTEAVKFIFLFLTYALVVASYRRVLGDERLAAAAALSFLAVYFFAWESVINFSHTVILSSFCMALFYTLLRLEDRGDWLIYGILGAVLGLGWLSKYGFALFALALVAAALADRKLRARLVHPRALLTLAVAAAIVFPHGLWLWAGSEGIDAVLRERLEVSKVPARYGADVMVGLGQLVKAMVSFLLPWLALVVALFWRAFGPVPGDGETARYRRLIGLQLVLVIGVFVIAVAGFGATRFRTTYMFVLFLAPLYFFARARALGGHDKSRDRFALVVALVGALVPVMLVVKFMADPVRCRKCAFHVPYAAIAAELRRAGFERGTILSHFYPHQIGGNLRPYFPDSRIASTKYRRYRPPGAESAGQCLLLWDDTDTARSRGIKAQLISRAKTLFGAEIDPAIVPRTIIRPLAMSETRKVRFAYVLVPGGSGACR